jgi:hypothetical protein
VRTLRGLTGLDRAAYLDGLSTALTNLALTLTDFGRPRPAFPLAEEALQLRRERAELDRDGYLHDYATAYMVVGHVLVKVGHYAEAVALHARRST